MGLNVYYRMILCTTAILNLSFSDSIPSKKKKKKKSFPLPHQKKGRTIHIPPKKALPNPQIISTFQQVYNQPTDQQTNRPTDHPPPRCVEQKRFDGHQKKKPKKRKKGGPGGKGGAKHNIALSGQRDLFWAPPPFFYFYFYGREREWEIKLNKWN